MMDVLRGAVDGFGAPGVLGTSDPSGTDFVLDDDGVLRGRPALPPTSLATGGG
jgi:hypothetical protein